MFARWSNVVTRLKWPVLAAALAFMAFAGIWGTGAFGRLDGNTSLNDPTSQSQQVTKQVIDAFGQSESTDIVALYSSTQYSVTDPQFRDSVLTVESRLKTDPNVAKVASYYDTRSAALVSTDGHSTYLAISLVQGYSSGQAKQVRHDVTAVGLTTEVGGNAVVNLDISSQVGAGIATAEEIAMPALCLLLIVVFGNLIAALMPILLGGFAILGAFTAIRVIEIFTGVSVYSINVVTILGLGLAVDYGLFIVTRYREELDRGKPMREAIARTMATAGRTVAVSGLLVALAFCSLLIFPQELLRSMGFGGAAAVLVAMVASLTVLPALLAVLGPRIDAVRLPWTRRGRPTSGPDSAATGSAAGSASAAVPSGRWAAIATSVMRRPVLYLVGVLIVIGVLAAPIAGIQFGGIDEHMLPSGTQSLTVSETLAADFPGGDVSPIRIFLGATTPAQAADFRQAVQGVPGVTEVSVAAQNGTATLLTAGYTGNFSSSAAQGMVQHIRALTHPSGTVVMVGGPTASVVDQLASLRSRLPWMALIAGGVTMLILAIAFGSILVPVKAIVMNLLSIGAAFGVVTWVFQDGHLSGVFGFTSTGYVEASQPVLMVAILFGLSMDYEVFLISRIRERWDDLGDNTAAVADGVQRTGRIITTAAALLCIVVGAFTLSGLTFIKMIGVGMVVALLVDATLVRLLLVPATMRLLGRYNWWAPKFLTALYGRYGVRENDPPGSPTATPGGSASPPLRRSPAKESEPTVGA